jgi:hypothetical protein
MTDERKPEKQQDKFWGWCECECLFCDRGDHHICRDTLKCGMPKTWKKDEKPRPR